MLQTIFLSSLHKVSPAQCPSSPITSLSGFQNEPISCQVAFRLAPGKEKTLPIYARVESDLPVSLYFVGYMFCIRVGGLRRSSRAGKYDGG